MSIRMQTMVRPEEAKRVKASFASCCIVPAGESPVRVSAGAPGSRPQAARRDPRVRAGRREPLRREQDRGPQRQVNPAASSDSQRWSRAAHVTAKAMPSALDPKRAPGPGGVGGVARTEGETRNTRDPSSRPSSRRAVSDKPRAKPSGAERESEGIVVVVSRAQQKVRGAKGPYFGRVG